MFFASRYVVYLPAHLDKRECTELVDKVTKLFHAFNKQTQRLSGTPLMTSVEDVKECVHTHPIYSVPEPSLIMVC